jgi:hypothetical protein
VSRRLPWGLFRCRGDRKIGSGRNNWWNTKAEAHELSLYSVEISTLNSGRHISTRDPSPPSPFPPDFLVAGFSARLRITVRDSLDNRQLLIAGAGFQTRALRGGYPSSYRVGSRRFLHASGFQNPKREFPTTL